MAELKLEGIHHITAIAGDPQKNVDFYAGLLGLRLVKKTVNFDDPGTYHLYFGDSNGSPGTVLTFFPWPRAPKGRHGSGQATSLAFSVSEGSDRYWNERLGNAGIKTEESARFGQKVISFSDPDGLSLELVFSKETKFEGWKNGPVPSQHLIKGFHSITLCEEGYELTANVLAKTMGLEQKGEEEQRHRFAIGDQFVDVLCRPDMARGMVSVGTVHHVAWRTESDENQLSWRKKLVSAGLNVTPVINRYYFHSIYYREPGGILFEIATDPPGFQIDESFEDLGTHLKLPPWLEPLRKDLEGYLPPIKGP